MSAHFCTATALVVQVAVLTLQRVMFYLRSSMLSLQLFEHSALLHKNLLLLVKLLADLWRDVAVQSILHELSSSALTHCHAHIVQLCSHPRSIAAQLLRGHVQSIFQQHDVATSRNKGCCNPLLFLRSPACSNCFGCTQLPFRLRGKHKLPMHPDDAASGSTIGHIAAVDLIEIPLQCVAPVSMHSGAFIPMCSCLTRRSPLHAAAIYCHNSGRLY
mmetsp:Transcript_47744/g.113456  ORF Transcript_47744/g.113456 Transcript_47744/m.113456 type:complete len:216 (-) Transcript_47744:34-681(-)